MDKSKIDEIVLCGGSSRIPKIRQMLKDYFDGKELNEAVNPDEAVAVGATVHAAVLAGQYNANDEDCEDIVLLDVNPLSLGIATAEELTDSDTEVIGDKFLLKTTQIMAILIEKNSLIPCEYEHEFQTEADDQQMAFIEIYEGESIKVSRNHKLG